MFLQMPVPVMPSALTEYMHALAATGRTHRRSFGGSGVQGGAGEEQAPTARALNVERMILLRRVEAMRGLRRGTRHPIGW